MASAEHSCLADWVREHGNGQLLQRIGAATHQCVFPRRAALWRLNPQRTILTIRAGIPKGPLDTVPIERKWRHSALSWEPRLIVCLRQYLFRARQARLNALYNLRAPANGQFACTFRRMTCGPPDRTARRHLAERAVGAAEATPCSSWRPRVAGDAHEDSDHR